MARVKGSNIHAARRKKVLKQAKGYFGAKWLGGIYNFPAKPLSLFNSFRISIAKIPYIKSPIIPFK